MLLSNIVTNGMDKHYFTKNESKPNIHISTRDRSRYPPFKVHKASPLSHVLHNTHCYENSITMPCLFRHSYALLQSTKILVYIFHLMTTLENLTGPKCQTI